MKIYQVIYAGEAGEEFTTYVGADRDEAFERGGEKTKIRVWIFGTDVEQYSYINGEWTLKYSVAESLEKKVMELADETKELKQKLEGLAEEFNKNKRLLDVLKAD